LSDIEFLLLQIHIKTLKMKTRNLSRLPVNLKLILFIPALIFTVAVISACSASKKSKATPVEVAPPPPPPPNVDKQKVIKETDMEEPFVVVEQMPVYPGGDTELLKYISTNTKYPEVAKNNNIQGRVIVRFCVNSNGKTNRASVLKGVSPELDAEALRVINTLPDFQPGMQGGKPVPVWYMVPITYALDSNVGQRPSRFEIIGDDTLYTYSKEMPKFPGGNDALKKFKSENIVYDQKLKDLGVEGFVSLNVIIEKDGTLSHLKILNGVSPSLDNEAMRVTKIMPAWEPGKENGKVVRFRNMISFEFLSSPREPIEHKDGEPFVVVEEMPEYPGGDSALLSYIVKNTKYPETAKTNNIQGRVIARFCVTETGTIDRVTILKGISPELDGEALRVVKSIPAFRPGKQGGKEVPVWYMVPITFALASSSADGKSSPPPPPSSPNSGYDEAPLFKGGEVAIYKFINSKIVYPPEAKEKRISGKVRLMICIDKDGSVNDTNVMPGTDPLLAAEASRVVRLLPKWTPGKLEGTPVTVWYPVNVTFTLK
jgi:TonB family protein